MKEIIGHQLAFSVCSIQDISRTFSCFCAIFLAFERMLSAELVLSLSLANLKYAFKWRNLKQKKL